MWQEESAIVPTFYIIFCSPKITSLQKQQFPNAAASESNEDRIKKRWRGKNIAGKKTRIVPELKAKKGWRPLKAPLSWVEKIELSSKSWVSERSVGWVLVKYWPSSGQVAKYWLGVADMLVGWCWPSLSRYIGFVSVDISISAECRSPYRPILRRQMP